MVDVSRVVLAVDSSQVKTASRDLDGLDKSGKATNKTAAMLGRTLVGLAGGFSALAAIRGTISTVAQFGQSMAEVSAITRATTEELSQMEQVARQLGGSTEFSASQAASAFKFLGMAGFSATESVAAIPDVLNLATAAALDLGVAADISSNVMSGFGIAASNAGRVADVLAAASSRANTDVSQLGSAIAIVGPVASAMGIGIGDAAAAIGVLSDAGIQGSSAGAGLRRVLSSLANPTGAAASTLRDLGVSLDEVNPATNSLTGIIDRLSTVGMSAADALTIFGDRGGPAILALVENNDRVRELTGELSNVEGEARRMADTMRDTLSGDTKQFISAMQEIALVIGGSQEGSMRSAVQGATGAIRVIGESMDTVATTATAVAAVFAGRLAASASVTAGAFVNAQIQAARYQATLASMAGVSRAAAASQIALAGSVRTASAAMALIGGPVGVATIAAVALYHFKDALFETFVGPLPDNIEGLKSKISELAKIIAYEERNIGQAAVAANEQRRREMAKYQAVLDLQISLMEDAEARAAALADQQDRLAKSQKAVAEISKLEVRNISELIGIYAETESEMSSLVAEHESFKDSVQGIIDRMRPLEAATRKVMDEYRTLDQAVRRLNLSHSILDEFMRDNAFAMFNDRLKATNASLAASHEMLDAHIEKLTEVKEEADPFAKAWETAMERIDSAFADAWKGAFDSFSDFADGLKNAFKQLLAEMAHMAITRPILVSLGLVGGSSGAMAGTGGAGGIGGLSSIGSLLKGGVGGLGSSIAGGASSLMTGFGHGVSFLADMGIPGMNELAIKAYQQGMTMTAGTALAGAAAGFAGSFAGNAVFGQTSGIGSGLGGMAGFALGGPLGAGIGSFLGSGLESGLNSLFGSKKDRIGGVGINTGTGEANLWGTKKDAYQRPMQELADLIHGFSDAIGGSGSMMTISAGNKSKLQMNGKEYADVMDLIADAMDDIIGTAHHLAPVVKDLAKAFDGSLEATAAYAHTMQSLWQAANQNPVKMAMQDMESANTTVMQAYRDQVSAISALVSNFDGSAASAQNLNAALAQNQQFAYQLAVAIRQVSGQLDSMFSGSAQAIRESAMTDEERLASMQEQRRSVLKSINDMYDPAEISAAAREFDRLNNAIFEMVGRPSGKAEAYAAYAERANEVAQKQLDRVLKEIERSQAEQNRDIRNGMLEAAAAQQQAAEVMLSAAEIMAAAAASFNQGGGFEVNV